ncbi:hypothetical protein [Arthrobacter sp. SO3]|uniref:hypothetical protein n=1 Tax=Arthrobacter sp. SO3 TaxID=1897057 RepID=UPI001CFFDEED|nr:hypothetical protein [Arthrobacter sp. SO3]MCB5292030.1 hypothetical protein [Arthrobacter sp. SO3]
MSTNKERFNDAYAAAISHLGGISTTDLPALEDCLADLYKACNPLAYDPSNPAAIFTPAQYQGS